MINIALWLICDHETVNEDPRKLNFSDFRRAIAAPVKIATAPWFYLFLGFFGGQIFAQCTTRRREPFSLECLILQRDLGEGTKCILPPIVSARGWTLFLHLNLALSNTTGGNYPVSMERRPHFQQRGRQTRRYR